MQLVNSVSQDVLSVGTEQQRWTTCALGTDETGMKSLTKHLTKCGAVRWGRESCHWVMVGENARDMVKL